MTGDAPTNRITLCMLNPWGGIHEHSHLSLSPNFRIFVIKICWEICPSKISIHKAS